MTADGHGFFACLFVCFLRGDENALKLDGDDGCTSVITLKKKTTLNYIL